MKILVKQDSIETDPWQSLRAFTSARIALGRCGVALPLAETLALKLAHANARDAVHSILDLSSLTAMLETLQVPIVQLQSCAKDRAEFLQRPDLGRMIHEEDLQKLSSDFPDGCDIVIILADGLSATAINSHVYALLKSLIPELHSSNFRLGPLCIVQQSRVAIGDGIGAALKAKLSLVFIGERPGLSSPDSMGLYLTYNPKPGLTDESRNCISNIRPQGLDYESAVRKIRFLVHSAFKLGLSGIALKEVDALPSSSGSNG